MTSIAGSIPILPAAEEAKPSADRLRSRLLRSGRIVLGGGIFTVIVLLCLATLPLTLSDSSPLYFDGQVTQIARTAPALGRAALFEKNGIPAPAATPTGIWSAASAWFGTDTLGRSLMGRCLLGGSISLLVGLVAAGISVFLGVTVGLVAGYRGGWVDALLMRFVDIMYGLPYILLIVLFKIALEPVLAGGASVRTLIQTGGFFCGCAAVIYAFRRKRGGEHLGRREFAVGLLIAALLLAESALNLFLWRNADNSGAVFLQLNPQAANLTVLFLAIGLVSWLTMARVVRGQVLSLRSQPFIEACRAMGLPEWRIFTRHLLPNLIGPIIVYATLTVPQAILQESFLSFLGIGIQPPMPTWGALASEGLLPSLNIVRPYWWMLAFPCILLATTLLSLNFLGDGLRDVFDPKREAAKI